MGDKNPILHSLEIIENQISEKLTVEHIANSIHFSKFHYQRLFREIVGDSVMEYVTKRKLTLAGKELLETDTPVVDIAIKFGFGSREGFARSFKAHMGAAPGEYRKYSLTAITKKTVKEQGKMIFSKATDEIIRELNAFIVTAKETANMARKEASAFWGVIADKTDALASKVQNECITAIAESPDEITNRFTILRAIEDSAFDSNILAFYVGLTVSREQPEHAAAQNTMCQKYYALANTAVMNAGKIKEFFSELSALIFEEINKSYTEKIQQTVQTAKSAIAPIEGYDNIKFELANLIDRLEQTPFDENTARRLNDYLFHLSLISFAADMEIFRSPNDTAMFEGLAVFRDALAEAAAFSETLPKCVAKPLERVLQKPLQDLAFQGNLLLFYTRGEIEKMNNANVLDDSKNRAMTAVCEKMNSAIQLANSATDKIAAKEVSQICGSAADEMNRIADELGSHGSPIKFLASEIKGLSERAMNFAISI